MKLLYGSLLALVCFDAFVVNHHTAHGATDSSFTGSPQDRSSSLREQIDRLGLDGDRPNIIFIIADQMRYDCIGHIQNRLSHYEGKLKVRTPNIDRLISRGAMFETAYCVSPTCAAARTCLKTGSTLERGGIQGNQMLPRNVYSLMDQFREKIDNLVSFEQVLVQERGYIAETFGKWHTPQRLYYASPNHTQVQNDNLHNNTHNSRSNIIRYNVYDFEADTWNFDPRATYESTYQKSLNYLTSRDNYVQPEVQPGQQINNYSSHPYQPIRLDVRYGLPTETPLSREVGFQPHELLKSQIKGRDTLPANYTSSAILGQMALKALDRLIAEQSQGQFDTGSNHSTPQRPFMIALNFVPPHPPMVATKKYSDYYFNQRHKLFIPPSINDQMNHSAYAHMNGRKYMEQDPSSYGYNDPEQVAEWIAIYYGMVEEVDEWVGKILDKLEASGLANATMVIFTSDHGEMLGAHAMQGKSVLLEDSSRIPLILSFLGKIPEQMTVTEPVSHLDLFATILDYAGASDLDHSDGKSLRRFIDQKSWNEDYDERTVVVEREQRIPLNEYTLSNSLGDAPNLMIRKGSYKLFLPKKADSPVLDMMYNLQNDPFEMKNLLEPSANAIPESVIGKAEHLKILLVEWMKRHDYNGYYSDNKYNLHVGWGDIQEIVDRRMWRKVDYWQSDYVLEFGRPAEISIYTDGTTSTKNFLSESPFSPIDQDQKVMCTRNEYLYLGRTVSGVLALQDVYIAGTDIDYFSVHLGLYRNGDLVEEHSNVHIRQQESSVFPFFVEAPMYVRLKVSYQKVVVGSDTANVPDDYYLMIQNNVTGLSIVNIVL